MEQRRNRTALVGGISALAVTLLLVGCTGIRGIVPDAVVGSEADCAEPGTAGRIPVGFEPVTVILCDAVGTVTDDDGIWSGPATRHLHGDLTPLIDALNRADNPRWPGPCTAMEVIAPPMWLADAAGRVVHVTYPVNGCRQPKIKAVNAAIALLNVTSTRVDRQELSESKAAVQAGCSTRWTPLRVVNGDELQRIPRLDTSPPGDTGSDEFATVPFGLPPVDQLAGMRLCRYSVDPIPQPRTDSSEPPMVGTFTSGSTLNTEDGRTVLAAADYEVMPPAACIRPTTAFVVAHPLIDGQDAGGTITIELDGCQRLFGDTGFTFASGEVLALVQPG